MAKDFPLFNFWYLADADGVSVWKFAARIGRNPPEDGMKYVLDDDVTSIRPGERGDGEAYAVDYETFAPFERVFSAKEGEAND